MAEKNIEARVIPAKKQRGVIADEKRGQAPERGVNFPPPSSSINELSYGKDGGKANAQSGNVPSVVVGGASEEAPLPSMPGGLSIGEDKNVSTPVSGG